MFRKIVAAVLAVFTLAGCAREKENTYRSISQEEALAMMASEKDYIILDVRRTDEFAESHLPDAVNVPNETITDSMPAELPDPNQLIFVYCRSGNRSKQAAEKLAAMGYTNIVEIGGITTWPGRIEEGEDMKNAFTKIDLIMDMHKDGELDGVTLSLKEFAYPIMKMVLSNQSGKPFTYGSAFVLETNDNGEWKETEQSRNMMWTMEAYELADGESVELSADISLLGDLYPDRYRIGKEGIMAEFRLVYTE
ncbi:MAG: rhodanese-like domain-containing protein [Solobacterium sp.]|nr:rhodanese-like domain-containing protein [Solobacterium sp.]